MQGKANFRGHPLHLILVSFPVAFWTGAIFTDAAGALRHDPFWFHMSAVLIAMGTVVALVASVCGYIDYRTVRMSGGARRVANRHFLWSVAATVIFAVASFGRAADAGSPLGIALSAGGALVLLVGAYFGSELANRYRIGIIDVPPPDANRAPL